MNLTDLEKPSLLILGLGQEGVATYSFLRKLFPEKPLVIADQIPFETLSSGLQDLLTQDQKTERRFGVDYLQGLDQIDIIIKSPGVPPSLPALSQARMSGAKITSHTELFFANCPGRIIGITGTKGKSTTASLLYQILARAGLDAHLVGNIGNPPLSLLEYSKSTSRYVFELSSYQLEGLSLSPHLAVLLNVVPEHLDYHGDWTAYVEAKKNITRYQTKADFLIYNAMYEIPRSLAASSKATIFPFSIKESKQPGCFIEKENICYSVAQGEQQFVLPVSEVPLLGEFNLHNVLAAVSAGRLVGASTQNITEAIRSFQPLEHRFELVGTISGITFYNASIATVPEATIEHIKTLGEKVSTLIAGGYDRRLFFYGLASAILQSQIKTLILFPTTGKRIWDAIRKADTTGQALPQVFFVETMDEAVTLAYRYTEPGGICLHSPASPSFGVFRNYRERGEAFKRCVWALNPA